MSLVAAALTVVIVAWQLAGRTPSALVSGADASDRKSSGLTSFDGLSIRGAAIGPGDEAIAPAPEAFDGPAEPEMAPPAAINQFAGVRPEGGTWAVVIGVNDYPGSRHDLRSAVNDADDMALALARMGVPSDHVLVLRDRQASARNMRMATDWLKAHSAPDAVAVFFYAGHVRKVDGHEAIVGSDGNLLRDNELASHLDGLQARRAWVAIAACFGGGFTEVLKPGRVLTAAAPANKLAYENSSFGRSYMVQYMVRKAMIEETAPETVQTSFTWARDAIARDHPGREPVQIDHGAALDLRPPGAPRARTATPAPSGSSGGGTSSGGGSSGGGSSPPPTTPPTTTCVISALGVRVCR